MGAAFVALGEALVDAIAVGLIGDDEDAAVGEAADAASRNTQAMNANEIAWAHRMKGEELPPSDRPKVLIMINHGARRRV